MTDLTLTPAQIVAELDRYIVGQEKAKRAVAIALRNRWRRQNLPVELRDEVAPDASRATAKGKQRQQVRAGRLDARLAELEMQQQSLVMIEVLAGQGMEEMGIHLKDMLSNIMPSRTKRRKVRVAEARRLLA